MSALPLRKALVEFWNSSVSASPSWRTWSEWKRFTFSDKLVAGVDGPPITSGTDRFTTFFAFLQWQGWLWNVRVKRSQSKNIYETGTSSYFNNTKNESVSHGTSSENIHMHLQNQIILARLFENICRDLFAVHKVCKKKKKKIIRDIKIRETNSVCAQRRK